MTTSNTAQRFIKCMEEKYAFISREQLKAIYLNLYMYLIGEATF